MSANELTEREKLLLYGLKQFNVETDDAVAISVCLKEDEQLLLIHFMKTHPNATAQDVLNESGRLIIQSKETDGLTIVEKMLISRLSYFDISSKDKDYVFNLLVEEDDKLLMVYYLDNHLGATAQDILDEGDRLIEQRKRIFGD